MADSQTPNPPSPSNTLSPEIAALIRSAVADAIGPVARDQKVLADTLAQLPPATPPAKPQGKAGDAPPDAITLADLQRVLDERDRKREQQTTAVAERERFVGAKLQDLPDAYRRQLGSDPAKWPDEAVRLREQYHADHKAAGNPPPKDVGGDEPGGAKPTVAIDLSKLSPAAKVRLGVEQTLTPTGPTTPNRAVAPAAVAPVVAKSGATNA